MACPDIFLERRRASVESRITMVTPTDENFNDYKKAEKKALAILAEMKATSPKKTDIELALLVAIFELHKSSLPAGTIVSIIQGHLKQLSPFYAAKP